MSNPAALAAVPGLIRAVRLSVEANAPRSGVGGYFRAALVGWLLYAETTAELLVEAVPEATEAAQRPVQQVQAPIASQAEPMVPRRCGHDTRLPPGRPHP